jgi:hypothetical protein
MGYFWSYVGICTMSFIDLTFHILLHTTIGCKPQARVYSWKELLLGGSTRRVANSWSSGSVSINQSGCLLFGCGKWRKLGNAITQRRVMKLKAEIQTVASHAQILAKQHNSNVSLLYYCYPAKIIRTSSLFTYYNLKNKTLMMFSGRRTSKSRSSDLWRRVVLR